MTLILDSGALIALERCDRAMWVRLKGALTDGTPPVTHAGVIGQVWRGAARQARLATALQGVDVRPIDDVMGRAAGVLLGRAGAADVIDAVVVLLAADDDTILTSDPDDIGHLLATADSRAAIVTV